MCHSPWTTHIFGETRRQQTNACGNSPSAAATGSAGLQGPGHCGPESHWHLPWCCSHPILAPWGQACSCELCWLPLSPQPSSQQSAGGATPRTFCFRMKLVLMDGSSLCKGIFSVTKEGDMEQGIVAGWPLGSVCVYAGVHACDYGVCTCVWCLWCACTLVYVCVCVAVVRAHGVCGGCTCVCMWLSCMHRCMWCVWRVYTYLCMVVHVCGLLCKINKASSMFTQVTLAWEPERTENKNERRHGLGPLREVATMESVHVIVFCVAQVKLKVTSEQLPPCAGYHSYRVHLGMWESHLGSDSSMRQPAWAPQSLRLAPSCSPPSGPPGQLASTPSPPREDVLPGPQGWAFGEEWPSWSLAEGSQSGRWRPCHTGWTLRTDRLGETRTYMQIVVRFQCQLDDRDAGTGALTRDTDGSVTPRQNQSSQVQVTRHPRLRKESPGETFQKCP